MAAEENPGLNRACPFQGHWRSTTILSSTVKSFPSAMERRSVTFAILLLKWDSQFTLFSVKNYTVFRQEKQRDDSCEQSSISTLDCKNISSRMRVCSVSVIGLRSTQSELHHRSISALVVSLFRFFRERVNLRENEKFDSVARNRGASFEVNSIKTIFLTLQKKNAIQNVKEILKTCTMSHAFQPHPIRYGSRTLSEPLPSTKYYMHASTVFNAVLVGFSAIINGLIITAKLWLIAGCFRANSLRLRAQYRTAADAAQSVSFDRDSNGGH